MIIQARISSEIFRFRQLGLFSLSQKAPEENPKEMKNEISMKGRRYVIPKRERAAALLLVGDGTSPVNAIFNQFIGSG